MQWKEAVQAINSLAKKEGIARSKRWRVEETTLEYALKCVRSACGSNLQDLHITRSKAKVFETKKALSARV